MQALKIIWGPGAGAFEGRHVHVSDASAYPRPLRGTVPIVVGGSGERRTLRLVARHADACNLFGDAEQVRRKLAVLHQHCRDVGRDPDEVQVTHLSTVLLAADPDGLAAEVTRLAPARGKQAWLRTLTAGTVEDHALRVQALADAGVRHVIVSIAGVWDSAGLDRFGEVISAVRAGGSS